MNLDQQRIQMLMKAMEGLQPGSSSGMPMPLAGASAPPSLQSVMPMETQDQKLMRMLEMHEVSNPWDEIPSLGR